MNAAALPLRRTWLAETLRASGYTSVFARLLRELAPERLARCQDVEAIYRELLAHIGALFPVYTPDYDWWEEMWGEAVDEDGDETTYDFEYHAFDFGIPVNVRGLDDQDVLASEHCPPALALGYALSRSHLLPAGDSLLPPALRPFSRLEIGLLLGSRDAATPEPPHGRRWARAWAGLPDFWDYVNAHTGCAFLDYSDGDLAEGIVNPPWDLDEIHNLADDWRRGAPIWQHVKVLVDYVGKSQARLLDLGRLLTGDEAARRRLSAPQRTKTLAQVFAREARHA